MNYPGEERDFIEYKALMNAAAMRAVANYRGNGLPDSELYRLYGEALVRFRRGDSPISGAGALFKGLVHKTLETGRNGNGKDLSGKTE